MFQGTHASSATPVFSHPDQAKLSGGFGGLGRTLELTRPSSLAPPPTPPAQTFRYPRRSSTTHCSITTHSTSFSHTLIPLFTFPNTTTHTHIQNGTSILHRRQLQDVRLQETSERWLCKALKSDRTIGTAPSSPSRRLSST